ncbi:MAG: hypothetical protein ACK5II_11400 [Paracoccus sp. (in: a-proteobacteria)]
MPLTPATPSIDDLAGLSVARISFGSFPWRHTMAGLVQDFHDQIMRHPASGA